MPENQDYLKILAQLNSRLERLEWELKQEKEKVQMKDNEIFDLKEEYKLLKDRQYISYQEKFLDELNHGFKEFSRKLILGGFEDDRS